jgi:hypothetical protein
MKVLKAKIYVDRSQGNTTYTYPQEWLDNKEKFPSILYPADRTDDATDVGGTYQFVYPIMDDATADALLAKYPDSFFSTSLAEVSAYAEKHAPQTTVINNQTKVLTLIAKTVIGQTLTQLEKDALDPTKSVDGVITTPPWTDQITQHGAKF